MSEELSPKRIGEPERTFNTTSESREEPNQTSRPVPSIPLPEETNRGALPYDCQIGYKAEKNWWDKAKPIVEVTGVVLLAVYTGFTVAMFWQIKKQTPEIVRSARAA